MYSDELSFPIACIVIHGQTQLAKEGVKFAYHCNLIKQFTTDRVLTG